MNVAKGESKSPTLDSTRPAIGAVGLRRCRSYTLKLYQAPVSRTVELSLEDVEDDDVRRTL